MARRPAGGGAVAGAKFPGTKIAITGFCMGGRLALIAAVEESDLFSIVAPFYGD